MIIGDYLLVIFKKKKKAQRTRNENFCIFSSSYLGKKQDFLYIFDI